LFFAEGSAHARVGDSKGSACKPIRGLQDVGESHTFRQICILRSQRTSTNPLSPSENAGFLFFSVKVDALASNGIVGITVGTYPRPKIKYIGSRSHAIGPRSSKIIVIDWSAHIASNSNIFNFMSEQQWIKQKQS
jgi:hypothetical protein